MVENILNSFMTNLSLIFGNTNKNLRLRPKMGLLIKNAGRHFLKKVLHRVFRFAGNSFLSHPGRTCVGWFTLTLRRDLSSFKFKLNSVTKDSLKQPYKNISPELKMHHLCPIDCHVLIMKLMMINNMEIWSWSIFGWNLQIYGESL